MLEFTIKDKDSVSLWGTYRSVIEGILSIIVPFSTKFFEMKQHSIHLIYLYEDKYFNNSNDIKAYREDNVEAEECTRCNEREHGCIFWCHCVNFLSRGLQYSITFEWPALGCEHKNSNNINMHWIYKGRETIYTPVKTYLQVTENDPCTS